LQHPVVVKPVYKPLRSVTHDQCNGRPVVTFPAVHRHCRLAAVPTLLGDSRSCVCEQLAQGRHLTAERPGVYVAGYITKPHSQRSGQRSD